jgi:hypothetical protein
VNTTAKRGGTRFSTALRRRNQTGDSPISLSTLFFIVSVSIGQTNFFQALNISTKIVKGAIEIVSEVHLIKVGEKVTMSHVAMLDKMNIRPFFYVRAHTSILCAHIHLFLSPSLRAHSFCVSVRFLSVLHSTGIQGAGCV